MIEEGERGAGKKENKNESEETEEIKTSPLYPFLLQGSQALPNCKPISVGRPSDIRYTIPSPNPNTSPSTPYRIHQNKLIM